MNKESIRSNTRRVIVALPPKRELKSIRLILATRTL